MRICWLFKAYTADSTHMTSSPAKANDLTSIKER